jgi:hypothetical protein
MAGLKRVNQNTTRATIAAAPKATAVQTQARGIASCSMEASVTMGSLPSFYPLSRPHMRVKVPIEPVALPDPFG